MWRWVIVGLGGCSSCPGSWPQCEVEQVWTSTTPQIQTNTVNSFATPPTTLYPPEQCYSESMSLVSSTSSQTPTGFKIILHNSSPSLLIAHLPSQPIGSSHLHPLSTHCFCAFGLSITTHTGSWSLVTNCILALLLFPPYWTFYILLH